MLYRVCPQKNKPCPCSSGKKYKHCCRPSGPVILDVPPFGKIERVGDLMADGVVYPVFLFQDTGDPDDIHMILDRRLQDEGYSQWLRSTTVGDGPSYQGIMDCHKKEGTPAISTGDAFEMNMVFANATLIRVQVLAEGIRARSPMEFERIAKPGEGQWQHPG